MTKIKEIWKDVVGYEGLYQISNIGRIKSYEKRVRKNKSFTLYPSRIMKQHKINRGYFRVTLTKSFNTQFNLLVHRMMAEAFIPNPENKPCVNHKNGIKTDNTLSNLEWCTSKENIHHAIKTGLRDNSGENHPESLLSQKQAIKIRYLYKSGLNSIGYLAGKYNVGISVIRNVVLNKTYKS